MTAALVVGGNRGIGLALVQELVSKDSSRTVFATTRNPSDSDDLNSFAEKANGKVVVIKLDMLDEASVKTAAAEVSKQTDSLDYLYINSGVSLGSGPINGVDSSVLLENMNANVVGPHNIFKAFAPMVVASKASKRAIAVTSSLLGSIGAMPQYAPVTKSAFGLDVLPIGCYGVSKTAVNALTRHWGDYLEPKGISVIAIHPGLVTTRMSKGIPGGIEPAESAKGFVNVVETTDISRTNDGIYGYDGTVYPW